MILKAPSVTLPGQRDPVDKVEATAASIQDPEAQSVRGILPLPLVVLVSWTSPGRLCHRRCIKLPRGSALVFLRHHTGFGKPFGTASFTSRQGVVEDLGQELARGHPSSSAALGGSSVMIQERTACMDLGDTHPLP